MRRRQARVSAWRELGRAGVALLAIFAWSFLVVLLAGQVARWVPWD